MESTISALSDSAADLCESEAALELDELLQSIRASSPLSKLERIAALLRVSQKVNRALSEIRASEESIGGKSRRLDAAVADLVHAYVYQSEEGISRTLDAIVSNDELFTDSPTPYPIELDDDLVSRVCSPPTSSSIYVSRQPRLAGLPDPPADRFGDWDEYRDDLDPGYRVREVYEDDESHSQSTSVTHLNMAVMYDDELQHVSSSYEPSPLPVACLDENDELTGAASSIAASHTPSLIMTADVVLSSSRRSERAGMESPTFGDSSKPNTTIEPIDSVSQATTYLYDYMGTTAEVPRPVRDPSPLNIACEERPLKTLSLPVIHEANKTGFEASKEFDSSVGTVVAGRYRIVSFLGSAAFSKCVKAVEVGSPMDREVCLKIIKNEKDFIDQSLDEIKILRLIKSQKGWEKNCLDIIDFFYWKEHLIIVTELLLDNLYEFSKFNRNPANLQAPYFTIGRLQRIAKQVCTALDFIHSLNLIHADLKPENILFSSYSRCEIRVIDFGSSCFRTDKLSSYVQSRSYRAPEVLLGCLPYDCKVDMWSLGCILAELWTGCVLFLNDSSQSLLARIIGIIGAIPPWMLTTGRNVPSLFLKDSQELYIELDGAGVVAGKGRLLQLLVPKKTCLFQRMRIEDDDFLDFLSRLLQIDPDLRMSAKDALEHTWLRGGVGKYDDGL